MSEGEIPKSHLGLQIAVAVSVGVLVIAATSVAAILLGSRRDPATTAAPPGEPSGSPAVTSATSPTQTTPTAPTLSPKRSPAKPPPSTAPAVTLRSLQCDRTESLCSVRPLSAAAPGHVTVALEADTSDVSMPSTVIVPARATVGEFVVRANGAGSGGPTTARARLGTTTVTTTIAVKVATAGRPSP